MKPKRSAYREPERVAELLPSLLRELSGGSGGRVLREIQEAWPSIVGEEAAMRCRPTALSSATLHVEAASSALKHHLSTFRGGPILKELKQRFPGAGIRAVRFR